MLADRPIGLPVPSHCWGFSCHIDISRLYQYFCLSYAMHKQILSKPQ